MTACRAILAGRNCEPRGNMNFESIVQEIKNEIRKLSEALRVLEGTKLKADGTAKRTVSAAARKRMARAQRARWRKIKAAK